MLGQSADFAHIHCVNLVSSTDLIHKRTGYLSTWLCVNPESELMYLIVSNLQRDMKSNNFVEIAAALTASGKLIRNDLMASINTDVTALMSHQSSLVRKKAIICMHSFYRKSEGAIGDQKLFREALCDKDPSVMGASLQLLYDVCLADPAAQIDLLPSFISILKQIIEHRLPRDFDYHRVPAPWLQLKLLKLLGVLIGENRVLAEKYKDILIDTMKRADTGLNIGHALIFEAINTITSIAPIPELIEAAADSIAKFLMSNNANMKYLGVTALSRIVKIDRKYAQEHQQIVMTCLEDPDDTIRRKTLTLLFAMCNENNVEPIIGRLIRFLADTTDEFLRQDLVKNICITAERFSTNGQWYVDTLNKVLDISSEHVPQSTIQGMLKLIAEGEGEDEAVDAELRSYCVETYFVLMESSDKIRPSAIYQIAAWVIGEYGFLTKKISRAMMLDRLCDMVERTADATTKCWIVTAMMKLVAHNGSLPDNVEDVITKLKDSQNVALQQRCYEFLEVAKLPALIKKALPLDGCCEEIEVDKSMAFLDSIVQDALSKGAKPYVRKDVRLGGAKEEAGLKTDAYKTQRVDVVDEEDLNADKFNEEEDLKIIVKDGARRWGAKNLEEEAAVEKAIESVVDAPSGDGHGSSEAHVDPMSDAPRKPTKNEKFLNDIFGEGGGKKKKVKKSTNRAEEALRRAQEAETATQGMTTENQKIVTGTSEPALNSTSDAPAGPYSGPKVQANVQKQSAPDCLRVRFGIMGLGEIRDVQVHLVGPAKCIVGLVTCAAPNSSVSGHDVKIPMIPANTPAFVDFAIRAEDYPVGGIYGGEIRYKSAAGEEGPLVRGGLNLALSDVLRPASSMNAEQFGQQWAKHAAGEGRLVIAFKKPVTPDVLQQHVGEIANLKIISVIGKEAIAAAFVVGCNQLLLAHMTVEGNNVNTIVRSANKGFSDAIAKQLFIA
eukprot:GILI01011040.1.p1 GENE.GILI01011040.1~~GILI01011040.1.p1  ORF type:complete len:955 (+),score=292.91 GILI01011040.1:24-2867(+)